MGKRVLGTLCVVLIALVCGTSAHAAVRAHPIRGLPRGVLFGPAAARLDDGGAILVGQTADAFVLARVDRDGALDRAYGTNGLAELPNVHFLPYRLAVDPATGAAWVGGTRIKEANYVAAVDAKGAAVSGFGQDGVLRLPQKEEPIGVQSLLGLAWHDGTLLIDTSNIGCEGCAITAFSAATGALLSSRTLYYSQLIGNCAAPTNRRVKGAGAVLEGSNILISASAYSSCPPQTVKIPGALSNPAAPLDRVAPTNVFAIQMASSGRQVCEGGGRVSRHESTVLWSAGQSHFTTLQRDGSYAPMIIVPIGAEACSALVPGGPGGRPAPASVFQIARGGARPLRTRLPTNFKAVTMYRSTDQLVVVGSVGNAPRIVRVPLLRGPFVTPRQ